MLLPHLGRWPNREWLLHIHVGGVPETTDQVLPLPLISHVMLTLHLPRPLFPHLYSGNHLTYLPGSCENYVRLSQYLLNPQENSGATQPASQLSIHQSIHQAFVY